MTQRPVSSSLSVPLTEVELAVLCTTAREAGFGGPAEYVRWVLRPELEGETIESEEQELEGLVCEGVESSFAGLDAEAARELCQDLYADGGGAPDGQGG